MIILVIGYKFYFLFFFDLFFCLKDRYIFMYRYVFLLFCNLGIIVIIGVVRVNGFVLFIVEM